MNAQPGQTIYFTSTFSTQERVGVIQEATSYGYLINGTWYAFKDINIKNVLLDSKSTNNQQILFG